MKGAAATVALLSAAASAQVVLMDIEKRPHSNNLRRRAASSVESDIDNLSQDGGYFIDISIGTPGQKFSLQLDTGSSDVWVPSSGSSACQAKGSGPKRPGESDGCSKGSFTSSKSSTFQQGPEDSFEIKYVDQSSAQGAYFKDSFQVGGVTVKNLTMGLAETTDIPFGLVGIGYKSNEASIATTRSTYPNLPIAMQTSGNIKTVAYSLWLNDLDASKGNLLFGGIDTEKYQGELALLDLLPDPRVGEVLEFNVPLTSIHGVSSSGTDALTSASYPITALLDSGTTLSYLPEDITKQIWHEVGAAYLQESQLAIVPCNIASTKSYFAFGFGGAQGPRINVTMDELVLESAGNLPFPFGDHAGESSCVFGIQAQPADSDGDTGSYLLGDTFLRSAYVVYDLVNNQVAIAPTQFNATSSNVVPFSSDGATIPSSSPVAGQNTTTTEGSQNANEPNYDAAKGFQTAEKSSKSKDKDSAAASIIGFSALGLVAVSMTTFLAIFASSV